jgi:pimeloyl-ACP methyl ester carboxylesterase
VRAYILGASQRGLSAEHLDALVDPWLGEEGQPAFYRQIADYDETFLAENERHLATLTIPVRVLWGAHDGWIPVKTGRRLAAMISSSSFQLIDGSGHLMQHDTPVALADEIRAWLTGRTGRPGCAEPGPRRV